MRDRLSLESVTASQAGGSLEVVSARWWICFECAESEI